MDGGWDDLRYFLALYRTGTLSAAARELGVSHVTVGRRMAGFAEKMGGELFHKTPDRYLLTELGESLLETAREVEAGFLRLDRVARGFDDTLRGPVRISTSQFLARFLVLPAATAVCASHPDIVLGIDESTRFVSLVRQEADVAVRMQFRKEGTAGSADVRVRYLGALGWAPFALGEPSRVIPYDDYAPGRPGEDWIAARGELAPIMTTSSMYCATYAAKQGLGVAFLPIALGTEEGLVQLDAPVSWMDVFVARHPDLDRNARVRVVFDAIVAQAGRAPGLFQS